MALGGLVAIYLQVVAAIFFIYFLATTVAVYFYMFWTGRLVRLQRALAFVVFFTALCAITLMVFGDFAIGLGVVMSAFFLLTLTKNILPVLIWLFILIVIVLGGTKASL